MKTGVILLELKQKGIKCQYPLFNANLLFQSSSSQDRQENLSVKNKLHNLVLGKLDNSGEGVYSLSFGEGIGEVLKASNSNNKEISEGILSQIRWLEIETVPKKDAAELFLMQEVLSQMKNSFMGIVPTLSTEDLTNLIDQVWSMDANSPNTRQILEKLKEVKEKKC